MSENKKNGPTDYSKFFEEERKKPRTEEISPSKEKQSFLANLKSFWEEADKKTKTQIIIFLIIIFLIILILSFYIAQLDTISVQSPFYVPAAE